MKKLENITLKIVFFLSFPILSGNPIFITIDDVIQYKRVLRHENIVSISDCSLRDLEGIQRLRLRRCTILNLSQNYLTCIDKLRLIHNRTIRIINLEGNDINIIDSNFLLRLKEQFPYLQLLDLSNNPINRECKREIVRICTNGIGYRIDFDSSDGLEPIRESEGNVRIHSTSDSEFSGFFPSEVVTGLRARTRLLASHRFQDEGDDDDSECSVSEAEDDASIGRRRRRVEEEDDASIGRRRRRVEEEDDASIGRSRRRVIESLFPDGLAVVLENDD